MWYSWGPTAEGCHGEKMSVLVFAAALQVDWSRTRLLNNTREKDVAILNMMRTGVGFLAGLLGQEMSQTERTAAIQLWAEPEGLKRSQFPSLFPRFWVDKRHSFK